MNEAHEYLYGNHEPAAESRLRGLESIEDPSTVETLTRLGVAAGWHCLEIGAGAGSIARWLAGRVGLTGRVVATDIATGLLDSSAYEVQRHDLVHDSFPEAAFDLLHMRHVLIHIDPAVHLKVLQRLRSALIPGGMLLVQESDLTPWRALPGTPVTTHATFARGLDATLSIYRMRRMDTSLGGRLGPAIDAAGFTDTVVTRRTRQVAGGSPEARYQELSARQLARSMRASDAGLARRLDAFADCFNDSNLRYESRATISVSARRGARRDGGLPP